MPTASKGAIAPNVVTLTRRDLLLKAAVSLPLAAGAVGAATAALPRHKDAHIETMWSRLVEILTIQAGLYVKYAEAEDAIPPHIHYRGRYASPAAMPADEQKRWGDAYKASDCPRLEEAAEAYEPERNELDHAIKEAKPATVYGLAVKMRHVWLEHNEIDIKRFSAPLGDDADFYDRLLWKAWQDAEALAREASV